MSAVDHTVVSVQVMEVVDPTLEKHPDVGYLEEKIVAAYEKGCNDLTEVEAVGPKLKLFYSQKRKGDVVRLACIHGNVALEESYMYEDDFQTLTAHMIQPYGHALVLLSLDDQLVLTQAAAIMRYVGKLTGLYPTSDDLYAAKIDMILEGEVELFAGLSVVRHKDHFGFDFMNSAQVASVYRSLNDEVLPRELAHFEALLETSASGWLAGGDGPSIADFILVPRLQWLVEPGIHPEISINLLDRFPRLKDLVAKYMALPALEVYHARNLC